MEMMRKMMMMETILMMWMDHAVDVCVCVVCVRDIKSGICMVHVILLKGAKGGFGGYRWTYLKGQLSCCQVQIFPPCVDKVLQVLLYKRCLFLF